MARNKRTRARGGGVLLVLEILLGAVMLFCLGKIGYTLLQYRKGAESYETIRAQVSTAPQAGTDAAPTDPGIDFAALQSQYPDAVAVPRVRHALQHRLAGPPASAGANGTRVLPQL